MTIDTTAKIDTGSLSKAVGAQIRLTRKLKGMTLNELARKCGTTAQTIQRIEVSGMTISVDWIETICNALEILPSYLFNTEDYRLANQVDSMRSAAEVLKVRSVDFIGRIDEFLKATD